MSTLAYATLTTRREKAPPGTSFSASPPGVRSYVDALAALVPAEVLTVHALILSFTTKTQVDAAGNSITTITEAHTLYWTFFGLMLLSVVLYAASRGRQLNRLDVFRAASHQYHLSPGQCYKGQQRSTRFGLDYERHPEPRSRCSSLYSWDWARQLSPSRLIESGHSGTKCRPTANRGGLSIENTGR